VSGAVAEAALTVAVQPVVESSAELRPCGVWCKLYGGAERDGSPAVWSRVTRQSCAD